MDEFANVALPDEFDKLLATMRSREISVSIIIQNMAQLKALFEKQWESIVGNCDTFLYLGGNEQSSHKYVSELLGKETIDTNTYGSSYGRNGNYSKNYQLAGRELMTPDEVRMLDNRYALLFIRGEFPVRDLKYDILKHPNIRFTTDGQGKPYIHGEDTRSIATLTLTLELLAQAETMDDLLTIESRLTDVRTELEQVASALRVFDNQVDYATIHLNISEVKEYTEVKEPETVWQRIGAGFTKSLKGVGNGLKEFFIWLVGAIPYLLLIGGIGFVIFIIIFSSVRRKMKRNAAQKKAEE